MNCRVGCAKPRCSGHSSECFVILDRCWIVKLSDFSASIENVVVAQLSKRCRRQSWGLSQGCAAREHAAVAVDRERCRRQFWRARETSAAVEHAAVAASSKCCSGK